LPELERKYYISISYMLTHFSRSVIRTVFDSCDGDRVGRIHINQLSGLLMKLGKDDGELDIIDHTKEAF